MPHIYLHFQESPLAFLIFLDLPDKKRVNNMKVALKI